MAAATKTTYSPEQWNSLEGKLFIALNEMRLAGYEKKYPGVAIQGGTKAFPQAYINTRLEEIIKPKTGFLWMWIKEGYIDKTKLISKIKAAQLEISEGKFSKPSADIVEYLFYQREKIEQIKVEKDKEISKSELMEKAKYAEKVQAERKAKKLEETLGEWDDSSTSSLTDDDDDDAPEDESNEESVKDLGEWD